MLSGDAIWIFSIMNTTLFTKVDVRIMLTQAIALQFAC